MARTEFKKLYRHCIATVSPLYRRGTELFILTLFTVVAATATVFAAADQTITVTTHAPASAVFGSVFTVAATASSGLVVTITADESTCSVVGGGTGSASIAMISGNGICVIFYDQAGSEDFNPAPQRTNLVNASRANQMITVSPVPPPNALYLSTFNTGATASSGLAVIINVSGPCTFADPTVTMTSGIGNCIITFNQAGNDDFNPAPTVTKYTTAKKLPQTIIVTTPAPATATYNGVFPVAATGGASGNSVVITSAGACTGSGNDTANITMTTGTWTCIVNFNQAGDTNYNAAAMVTENVTAQKKAQTITVTTAAPGTAIFNTTFTPAATSDSGLSVAITVIGVCSKVGTLVKMTSGTGNCAVRFDQAGNANFAAAPQIQQLTAALKADQTITVTIHAPATKTYNSSFSVAASATSGLAVTITVTGGVCAKTSTVIVKMTAGAGTCTTHYNQPGNANYNAAPEVTEDTSAVKAAQTITFGAISTKHHPVSFIVSATATSGLGVTFTAAGSCTVLGNIVTTTGTGLCTISAHQAGNANYNAASDVARTFLIT